MTPTTHTLLICVLFLCGLDETVLSQSQSQRGLCVGNQCFALFQESEDFPGAQKSCKDTGGQLFTSAPVPVLTTLLSGISGTYWLQLLGTGTTAGLQNCSSVCAQVGRNSTFLQEPCSEKLNGFLCQYTYLYTELCSRLQTGEGAQVKYTTHMGFEVNDSATFPPGTIAVAGKVGDKYPDSKHICSSMKWIQAPWTCEVMQGGCEHSCNRTTHSCICPSEQTLHPNNITCNKDPCADCAHQCQKEGDTHVCRCNKGYRLAQDGKGCVDVNECKEESPCTGEGEECVNTQGGFECSCEDGFEEEDGVCVNVSICEKCEHLRCEKSDGVYECQCREGFRVLAQDPTKCELYCTEQDCPAKCIPNTDMKQKDLHQCFCPEGYIQDIQNNIPFCTDINECEIEQQCDHKCENSFGSFKCLCDEGFELQDDYMCVPTDVGSGSTPPYSPPASAQPAVVPSYIKTGSVLGITLFMVLCVALVYFLVRNMVKRCGKLELLSLKGPDMDIFYLQQNRRGTSSYS